jgi:hypothetical protein
MALRQLVIAAGAGLALAACQSEVAPEAAPPPAAPDSGGETEIDSAFAPEAAADEETSPVELIDLSQDYPGATDDQATFVGPPDDRWREGGAVDFGSLLFGTLWPLTAQTLDGVRIPGAENIPVCWEETPAEEADFRALVWRSVEETWEEWANVRFAGWSRCSTNQRAIRIRAVDSGQPPRVLHLGHKLYQRNNQPVRDGMTLNPTFVNWDPRGCRNPEKRDACIRAIAVHEFGHALGFTHEQNRPDIENPGSCSWVRPSGTQGDTHIGDPDLEYSIMSGCAPLYSGNEAQLSQTDICMAQIFYCPSGAPGCTRPAGGAGRIDMECPETR